MRTILTVEDDHYLCEGISLALKDSETIVRQCHDIKSAWEVLQEHTPDLILLDVNLPDGSGLDFLREIRGTFHGPVILLTVNDTEMDVVMGLEQGASDYITKPFSLAILRARVNARFRQIEQRNARRTVIDSYEFDFDNMIFLHRGEAVELSKTEQRLLHLLVENRGITMARGILLDRVWGDGGAYVDENTLSVAVKRLRSKLRAEDYIRTVYGLGYVWRIE